MELLNGRLRVRPGNQDVDGNIMLTYGHTLSNMYMCDISNLFKMEDYTTTSWTNRTRVSR